MDEEDGRRPGEGAPLTARSDRRVRAAALLAGAALSAFVTATVFARDDGDAAGRRTGFEDVLVVREQRRGVDRALAWIADHQQPGGMWGSKDGTCVADTALSVLALMAGGSTVGPGVPAEGGGAGPETTRGPYAKQVQAGIKYLAGRAWAQEPDKARGYIRGDSNSKMHGHGFATLALAEACGSLGPTDIRRISAFVKSGGDPTQLRLADQVRWALELAVGCTERAQDQDTGGWSYTPLEGGHEGSMTVTQIIALRAASESGVRVNAATMRGAYDYVRKSQNLATPTHHGGFAYQINMRERVSYGLTAAALTTFFGLGRYGDDKGDRDVIRFGLEYLDRNLEEVLDPGAQWFYYNLFYGAQALYMSADERRIRDQWPRIRAAILSQQARDGSFPRAGPANDTGGIEYSTAIACLTLQVPMETLPIFQRR